MLRECKSKKLKKPQLHQQVKKGGIVWNCGVDNKLVPAGMLGKLVYLRTALVKLSLIQRSYKLMSNDLGDVEVETRIGQIIKKNVCK